MVITIAAYHAKWHDVLRQDEPISSHLSISWRGRCWIWLPRNSWMKMHTQDHEKAATEMLMEYFKAQACL